MKTRSEPRNTQDSKNRVMGEFPKHPIDRALRIAQLVENENGGKPMPPTDIAIGIGMSPGSSSFRVLLSASYKYGLTSGSYKQDKIELTGLSEALLTPTDEQSRQSAMRSAALTPPIFRGLYDFFKGKKLPEGAFLENTIAREFGVSKAHTQRCAQVFRENLEIVGLLRKATTGVWVSAENDFSRSSAVESNPDRRFNEPDATGERSEPDDAQFTIVQTMVPRAEAGSSAPSSSPLIANRVFVTHGRNRELVPQLKELLTFGQFEPIVSVEREAVSKPVPDKVMDDMRSCGAAIIHVDAEQEVHTQSGERMVILNQNVLIEIGAAMALYGRRFILLVKEGTELPSNLRGLYEVRYAGEKLDGDATLRLLKAFNEFKSDRSKQSSVVA